MKHLRILFTTVLLIALGTVFAFADVAVPFHIRAMYWAIYIVPIAIIVIGLLIFYRTLKNYKRGRGRSGRDEDR